MRRTGIISLLSKVKISEICGAKGTAFHGKEGEGKNCIRRYGGEIGIVKWKRNNKYTSLSLLLTSWDK